MADINKVRRRHHEITLYITPASRMCELAKTYFLGLALEFKELDVRQNQAAFKEMVSLSDQDRAPVVVIDGRVVPGYHPEIYDLILEGKYE